MRAVIYTRVSSEKQIDNTSLDFQEEECKKFCEFNGYDVVKVFREEGASARTYERPILQRALEYCANNDVSFFVVHRLDRFARDIGVHHKAKTALLTLGVRLLSVQERLEDTEEGEYIENIFAATAEYQNKKRLKKLRAGTIEKYKEGLYPNPPPAGYIKQATTSKGVKPMIIDPERGDLVAKALNMFATGCFTVSDIVDFLNTSGYRTHSGKKVYKQMVSKMLRKKIYTGIIEYRDLKRNVQEVKGQHEPLINLETYRKIQAVLSGNNFYKSKNKSGNYKFSKMIRCDNCSHLLSPYTQKNRVYYRCSNYLCKDRVNASEKILDEQFAVILHNATFSKKYLDFFNKRLTKQFRIRFNENLKNQSRMKLKRDELESMLKNAAEMAEKGVYSYDKYKEREKVLNTELTTLEIELSNINIDINELEFKLNICIEFIYDLPNFSKLLIGREKAKFIQLLFPDGLYYKEGKYRTPRYHSFISVIQENNTQSVSIGGLIETITDFYTAILTLRPYLKTPM